MQKVKLTVVGMPNAPCMFGHNIGDEIIFDGTKIQGDICPMALASLYPRIYAIMCGARFPYGRGEHGSTFNKTMCPDNANPVFFKIETIGLDSIPAYVNFRKVLLEKIEKNPGITVEGLLNVFSNEEKEVLLKEQKDFAFTLNRIKYFVKELEEWGFVKYAGEGKLYTN